MPLSTPKRPAPPPPTLDPAQMKIYFDRVDKNGNGLISVDELQEALYNGTEDEPFNLSTVRLMMDAFNGGNHDGIDFDHFGHLWKYVTDWQRCFRQFDADKSGSISEDELHAALTSFGYNVSQNLTNLLINRFTKKSTESPAILFDDFIRCCLILHDLTREFQSKDVAKQGRADISYEDFIAMILNCKTIFK